MIALLFRIMPAVALLEAAGCASTYYDAMERKGIDKTDILVEQTLEARGENAIARQAFADLLQDYRTLSSVSDKEFLDQYDRLRSAFQAAGVQTQDVRLRTNSVNDVARRLFEEEESKLAFYENEEREQAEARLDKMRSDFDASYPAMKASPRAMESMLALYRDEIDFLKENPSAAAAASQTSAREEIERSAASMAETIDAAIAAADTLIENME